MGEKKRILLVDDEESLCRILKLNLEETGKYDVRTESRGVNVMPAIAQFHPDLVVLDFIMPDMDGGDILKQLESNPKTKSLPIIFLTAIASKDDTQDHGSIIGGHFVLAKPITVEELLEAIERKLAEKGYH